MNKNSLNLIMEKFNPIERQWIATLERSDPANMMIALYEIRNSGSVGILPQLFKLINKDTDSQIRNEIVRMLSEIKTQEAVPVIAESLKNHDYGDYMNTLVAACWQSGLDFSKHLSVFAGLFIQSDYKTALEAFTVIEESLDNASEAEIYECIRFLKDAECMVTDEKMPLFLELRKVVESC
jgi:HEAT repeat protein